MITTGYKDVGNYTVIAKFEGTDKENYEAIEDTKSATLSIIPADQNLNISLSENPVSVLGSAPILTVEGAKTNLTYTSSNTGVATISNQGIIEIKGVGKTTITVIAVATNNYNEATATIELTVTKDGSLSKANFELGTNSPKFIYDYDNKEGKAQYANITVKNTGIDEEVAEKMTVYYENTTKVGEYITEPVDAGTYNVYVTVAETTNYAEITEKIQLDGQYVIRKGNVKAQDLEVKQEEIIYDSNPHEAEITIINDQIGKVNKVYYHKITGTDAEGNNIEAEGSLEAPTKAGKYVVRVCLNSSTNYYSIKLDKENKGLAIGTLEIKQAMPEFKVPTGLTAIVNQTLASVDLSSYKGFSFPDTKVSVGSEVGQKEFDIVYTPDDTENYQTVTTKVTIQIIDIELADLKIEKLASFYVGNEVKKSELEVIGINNDGTEAGEITDYTITYKDNDSGKIKEGSNIIIITKGSISKEIEITGIAKTPQAEPIFSLSKTEVKLTETAPTTSVKNVPAESGTITYSSSDKNVATIDENGVITLVGAGKTQITVTFGETNAYSESSKTIELTVSKDTLKQEYFELGNLIAEDYVYDGTPKSINKENDIIRKISTTTNKVIVSKEDVPDDKITVHYYQNGTEITSPTNAGKYDVYITVEATTKYDAITDANKLLIGEMEITKRVVTVGLVTGATKTIYLCRK